MDPRPSKRDAAGNPAGTSPACQASGSAGAAAAAAGSVRRVGPVRCAKAGRTASRGLLRRAALTFLMLAPGVAASASAPEAPQLCEAAAARAARDTGVPLSILRAVALTETGRRLPDSDAPLSPWPWAINEAGEGRWHASRSEAEARAVALLERGVGNFDVGCFQINWRWHGENFASVSEMFDPDRNALYAAELLRTLFDRSGDWRRAVGDYHSATPELARAYLAKFGPILDRLGRAEPSDPMFDLAAMTPVPEARVNGFPLLRAGGRGQGGSLFPAVAGGRRLIGD